MAFPSLATPRRWTISAALLPWLLAVVFGVFYNKSLFSALWQTLDFQHIGGILFGLSLCLVLLIFTALIMSLFVLPRVVKPLLVLIICIAACVAYFMDSYGVVIHTTMVQNTIETDTKEVRGLVNGLLVTYFILLGLLPSALLLRTTIVFGSFKQELIRKAKLWGLGLVAIALLVVPFTADYASFFRNHKNIRQMANPTNFIYATLSYALASNKSTVVKPLGEDAKLNELGKAQTKPTLFVFVVGETARADHFSINGYHKPTTPLLAQQSLINYSQVYSCGTETAVSVPCMFSNLGRSGYSDKKAKSQEGLLDLVKRSNYQVLWRDNNSGCKGTCNRVDYEDMSNLKVPELCNDEECFDNILLHQLSEKLTAPGNKLIVLHQKGSHGPEYFRRYPPAMEVFKPVCKVNRLQDCSDEEINNAFDNTIHYTDDFLNNTIEWLKQQSEQYNTALLYVSDHGESLGEKNLYLHGMPYLVAPKEQKHVPMFFWLSPGFEQDNKINRSCLQAQTGSEYSHDNLFHTVLSLLNINTSLYKPELDMLLGCRHN
jgi:lipid A ethanolaminephosphotransferase